MCGRARLSSDVSEIKLVFRIPPERPIPNFPPSWNVAPTDSLPVVRSDAKAGQRSLDLLRWGLIPYWAKDIKVGFANINAKAAGTVKVLPEPGQGQLWNPSTAALVRERTNTIKAASPYRCLPGTLTEAHHSGRITAPI